MDAFQKKYIEHQNRKKRILTGALDDSTMVQYSEQEIEAFEKIFKNRHSHRTFKDIRIPQPKLDKLFNTLHNVPSSCNRKAIKPKVIRTLNEKLIIEKTLKGGRSWINKSDKIILLFADMTAYKSPNEKDFMPYLDGGFVGMSIYLICESLGIKTCFVNPNMDGDKEAFYKKFVKQRDKGNMLLVGAMALGM